ncbi:kinase-like protein [Calocera cornea HHB12733]|uniref:Kinase-like protein n=1 Tax=Calocera cornea HHB12733 TaxID=1353952 RepID=A0A165G1F2_9BASI|nr:kinase-like protein [Calocera cornea HHB12733]
MCRLQEEGVPFVPRLWDCVSLPKCLYPFFICGNYADEERVILLMTRLEGEPVADRLSKLTATQLDEFSTSLASVFEHLHQIPAPGSGVCGYGGRPCISFQMSLNKFGPFSSLKGFNNWMLERTTWRKKSDGSALASRNHHERLVLAHGDLTPHNVLMNDDGQLTGVIDWECAAWMPAHWDASYVCI